jgi:aspartyl-tRNA synthetase
MERTYIGDLGAKAGETVLIKGWVDVRRDQGKMVFFDFRDMTGTIQGVVLPNRAEVIEVAKTCRPESVLQVEGIVNKRPERNVVADKQNGDIELEVTAITILNNAEPLPWDWWVGYPEPEQVLPAWTPPAAQLIAPVEDPDDWPNSEYPEDLE